MAVLIIERFVALSKQILGIVYEKSMAYLVVRPFHFWHKPCVRENTEIKENTYGITTEVTENI